VSAGAAIGFGALGGLLGWVVLFAFPQLKLMWAQDTPVVLRMGRVVLAAGICAVYVLIGACAAPMFDAGAAKEAVLYGVAGEGLFAGFVKAATV
jgi:hypothetical protein